MKEIDLEAILDKKVDLYNNAEGRSIDENTILKAMRESVELALDMVKSDQLAYYKNLARWQDNNSNEMADIIDQVKSRIK